MNIQSLHTATKEKQPVMIIAQIKNISHNRFWRRKGSHLGSRYDRRSCFLENNISVVSLARVPLTFLVAFLVVSATAIAHAHFRTRCFHRSRNNLGRESSISLRWTSRSFSRFASHIRVSRNLSSWFGKLI